MARVQPAGDAIGMSRLSRVIRTAERAAWLALTPFLAAVVALSALGQGRWVMRGAKEGWLDVWREMGYGPGERTGRDGAAQN